jgi:Uri superfamily endonuclease
MDSVMDIERCASGTYVLLLRVAAAQTIDVGRLGALDVQRGTYTYVGSAFGPGGVHARVRRHWEGAAAPHWHIDYLRGVARLDRVWHTYDPERRECAWAQALRALPGAAIPMKGFGASDCRCTTHLLAWTHPPSLAAFRDRLLLMTEAHAPIYVTLPRRSRDALARRFG